MRTTTVGLTALLIAAMLAGCAGDGPETAEQEHGSDAMTSDTRQGSASVYLKDAPDDEFAEVHVVVTAVEVHAAGEDEGEDDESLEDDPFTGSAEDDGADDGNETSEGNQTSDGNQTSEGNQTSDGNQTADGNETSDRDGNETSDGEDGAYGDEADSDDGRWITIVENETGIDVDLLNASGSRAAFLGEANLTEGKYTQIRIHVDHAYGITHDGERVEISVPSDKLRVIKPFAVHADAESRIIVDIDLDASLKQQGPYGWMLRPVIGMVEVAEAIDGTSSGAEVHAEGEVAQVA